MMGTTTLGFLAVCLVAAVLAQDQKPHIVFIVIDDLGYNDVGFRHVDTNTFAHTPFMDSIASDADGTVLERSYVQPTCSPSRTAMLTGRYPFKLGMQSVISADVPFCIPLSEPLMPEILKQWRQYRTHKIGKWHLGFCDERCTPEERGFDTTYGPLNGGNQINHTVQNRPDFRDGPNFVDHTGEHSADLFTAKAIEIIQEHAANTPSQSMFMYLAFQSVHSPILVNATYIDRISNTVVEPKLAKYLALASQVDTAIEKVVLELKAQNMYDNSVIVITSDNGGSKTFGGNNLPYKGNKNTYFEGGIRATTLALSPLFNLPSAGYVNNGLFHASDWLPTFMTIADIPLTGYTFDGVNQWPMLSQGDPSARQEVIVEVTDEVQVMIKNNLKYMTATVGRKLGDEEYYDPQYDQPYVAPPNMPTTVETHLYDLSVDELETDNINNKVTRKTNGQYALLKVPRQEMIDRLADLKSNEMKLRSHWSVPVIGGTTKPARGDPWTWGWCDMSSTL